MGRFARIGRRRRRVQPAAREAPAAAERALRVSCAAWLVADADTGEPLFAANAHARMPLASLTKLCTAAVVLEQCARRRTELSRVVAVSERAAAEKGGTHAGLRAGDRWSVRALLAALLLPSGNDAAVALAEAFGARFAPDYDVQLSDGEHYRGRQWTPPTAVARFVAEMNRHARRLGCRDTVFVNPHGMAHPGHASTASDAARLCVDARRHAFLQDVVGRARMSVPFRSSSTTGETAELENTNALLALPGYGGLKTGWVPVALPGGGVGVHGCLATTLAAGSRTLLVVVLGSTSKELRFVDAHTVGMQAVSWLSSSVGGPSGSVSGESGSVSGESERPEEEEEDDGDIEVLVLE